MAADFGAFSCMLKKLLIGLVVLVLVLVAVIASRPSTYHVERAAVVAAPPAVVFAEINDFHAWTHWSPWAHRDPQMTQSFDGPATGVGATYGWTGNNEVGEGRMIIIESRPPERVALKLEFIKPMAGSALTTFTVMPTAQGTSVTWAMDGESDFLHKAVGLVMDMDAMIGKDFEDGLGKLKSYAETEASKAAAAAAAAAPVPDPAAAPAGAPAAAPAP